MPKKLAVLLIHGMGDQDQDYADDMVDEIKRRIAVGGDPSEVEFEPVFWADLLSTQQRELWDGINDQNDLDYSRIRRFVLNSFGDATAYQRVPDAIDGTYARVHRRIRESLERLNRRMGDTNPPLLVLAHSLGCVMMSNYIYDQQHPTNKPVIGTTPFEQMQTFCGFVTFGCNIVLFSLAHSRYVGMTFPPLGLPLSIVAEAAWLNYYDPDDVLGWPVKQLCPEYQQNTKITDIAINVGGLLTSWNPASHLDYWEDNDLTKPIADKIVRLLRVI